MAAARTVERTDPYAAQYAQLEDSRFAHEPGWLRQLRRTAIERFQHQGFPAPSEEEWKYTDVAPIARTTWRNVSVPSHSGVTPTALQPFTFPGMPGAQLVFVDGLYAPTLSTPRAVTPGLRIASLSDILRNSPTRLEAHLGQYADFEAHPFTALNTAFFQDGALIEVERGTVLDAPIHLLFVSLGRGEPAVAHPRNLVLVGEGAQAIVVESYVGLGAAPYLTNAVTELVAGPASVVEHYKVQRETEAAYHVDTLHVLQDRNSRFTSHGTSLGGALVRNDINAEFDGEGGDCALYGLYAVTGTQHVDNHTTIDHRKPHCTSRQTYKGILDDHAKGVFYGKVYVRKDAQKTDAGQTNKNLVLSDHALVNSTPALEINADDVKCTHASATGQLSRDALFYLRTRGYPEATARGVLIYAFAREIINRVRPEPLRARLDELLVSRLPDGRAVKEAL